MEDTINEDPILAIAVHVEVRRVVIDFQVPPRNEGRVAHVYVDISFRTVPTDDDARLTNHVLKFSRLQSRNGS